MQHHRKKEDATRNRRKGWGKARHMEIMENRKLLIWNNL